MGCCNLCKLHKVELLTSSNYHGIPIDDMGSHRTPVGTSAKSRGINRGKSHGSLMEVNPAGSRGIPGGNTGEPVGFHRKSNGMPWNAAVGPRRIS